MKPSEPDTRPFLVALDIDGHEFVCDVTNPEICDQIRFQPTLVGALGIWWSGLAVRVQRVTAVMGDDE